MPGPLDPDLGLPGVPFLLGDQVTVPWEARDGHRYVLDATIIDIDPAELGGHRVLLVGRLTDAAQDHRPPA